MKLNISQQYVLVEKKANGGLGCNRQNNDCKCREVILPLLITGETTPEVLCPGPGSQYTRDIDGLERVQQKATEMMKGLKHLSYEEQLREVGLFSLEKERLWKDLFHLNT